tara:strand:+ start:803 stop:1096 length:294 start_codon:yes stop_codon:yes gene_type:complete
MVHQENTNTKTSYVINEGVSFQSVEDEYIILNINNGEYYELNSSSSFIWDQISAKFNKSEIIENCQKYFNLSDDQILEILSILERLEGFGLISEVEN